jgi:hypothetical protein
MSRTDTHSTDSGEAESTYFPDLAAVPDHAVAIIVQPGRLPEAYFQEDGAGLVWVLPERHRKVCYEIADLTRQMVDFVRVGQARGADA